MSDDGEWIFAQVTPEHVRLLRLDKFDAGTTASGEHLCIEQPRFLTLKISLQMHLGSGQRTLIGVHKLPGDEEQMELFFLRIETRKVTTSLALRNGRRVLMGVFKVGDPEKHMELFIVRAEAKKVE